MDTRTPSPTPEAAALAAIEQVGARVFKVTRLPAGQPLHFYVLGCQGEEGERQKAVARIMNDKAADRVPAFLLYDGDNIYDGAVESAEDKRFYTRYHQVYNLPNLAPVPGILVLGNHDANLENFAHVKNKFYTLPGISLFATPFQTGKAVEKFEVAHTYLHKDASFYKQDTLPINELPKWGMPYYFCSYDFIDANTQLFCLNSNTFVSDFLRFWENEDHIENADHTINQAIWLDQTFFTAKQAGRATMLALHNPLLTSSKRALPHKYDAHLYMTPKQIQKMNYILSMLPPDNKPIPAASLNDLLTLIRTCLQESDAGINAAAANMPLNGSYADMLSACLRIQGIKPDVVFAAHDHALVYNRTNDLCQVISGAGGSTNLMKQEVHTNDAAQGCFVSEPGFVAVTCDAFKPTPEIQFDFHTTEGKHLRFTNASCQEATPSSAQAAADAARSHSPALK